MKKQAWVLLGVLTFIFTPTTFVHASQNQPGLLIAEVQSGSATSASDEFIELYNASDQGIDLSKYKIEYFSATSTNFNTPSRSIAMSSTLYPGGRYLLASTNYLAEKADVSFSPTLAKTGGHLRVVSTQDGQTFVHDLLGWGSATMPETSPAAAPNSGESLQRKLNADGTYQDTDNNTQDFATTAMPTPESVNPQPPTPEPEPVPVDPAPAPTPDPEPQPEPDPSPAPEQNEPDQPVLPLLITELLPNPGSPKADAADEFVELYNPNDVSIDLANYRIETGSDYSYHFVFGSQTIEPHQYLVLTSSETNLTLSNSGGRARILHPDGSILFETSPYSQADDDMAWVLIGGSWQWSTTPTPGQANIATQETEATKAATAKKAAAAKPKTTKASATKLASTKTTKPKTAATKATRSGSEDVATADKKSSFHPLILAGIGVLALGYACYEYRADIANRFRWIRNYRKNRGGTGQSP
jgi:hypothetical protein